MKTEQDLAEQIEALIMIARCRRSLTACQTHFGPVGGVNSYTARTSAADNVADLDEVHLHW